MSGSSKTAMSGASSKAVNFAGLNSQSNDEAHGAFLSCCHCARWASDMNLARPYDSAQSVFDAARDCWQYSTEAEKLEAFLGHPQIGDLDALRNKYASSANREQGQITQADEQTLVELAELNKRYLTVHGFIFIVCATGKSAAEMLKLLKDRIENSREDELKNAAHEQGAITQLRLEKLLSS
ncbi:MAG: 2-oxo-4-hydroxy-4-carboxy-5-ureidoimidazoline decarboxylase [Granulosicoccus sp.]|jgi:2-oxo-4-hydroxy-4-carboxy-5-ureidoimidazoline decarboxylase